MRLLFMFLVGLLSVASIQAQVGQKFPFMEVENLVNKQFKLPKDIEGKYTLVGVAYSKKAEDALNTWYSPIYNQFMVKDQMFGINYDMHMYFIPMFSGHKTVAYKKVMKKFNETVREELHPHILFYKGSIKDYKQQLNFDKGRDLPYFFLINQNGEIVYRTSGVYTSAKMQTIIDKVDAAIGF